MSNLPGQPLWSQSLKTLAALTACLMLSGCYSCSLNGGWEGQMNPFCVEKNALIGPVSLSQGVAMPLPREEQPLDTPPTKNRLKLDE